MYVHMNLSYWLMPMFCIFFLNIFIYLFIIEGISVPPALVTVFM